MQCRCGVAYHGCAFLVLQVVLPASVGAQLTAQDAAKNGAMLFELRSAVTGATTHAGVLEFNAPEGMGAVLF